MLISKKFCNPVSVIPVIIHVFKEKIKIISQAALITKGVFDSIEKLETAYCNGFAF